MRPRPSSPPDRDPSRPGVSKPLPIKLYTALRGGVRLCLVLSCVVWIALYMTVAFGRMDAARRRQHITGWARTMLGLLGVQLEVQGHARPGAKLVVANHISWLDIAAIDAVEASRFVSKAEVARWPVVGTMVTLAGTIYLERARRRDALRVVGLVRQTLQDGHVAAVFPEGTTGDGHALLPFYGNVLQAAIDADVPVQPIALRYSDAHQAISPAAAYVGDINLMGSLWRVASADQLKITAVFLDARRVTHADRRQLAEHLREDIAQALARIDTTWTGAP
jgi:1-acyl-sn-glycerol-3-phosphate acyltransferase